MSSESGVSLFEDAAERMLKYLEDSEDLKVSLSELKEQQKAFEEAGFSIMQIAQQARNERGQKLFETFRQGENEVYIASAARWDTQLKGLVELEGNDEGGKAVKRKTRSSGWPCGRQDQITE